MPITYELIQSVTASNQGTVSFTSIPQTYSDLEIRVFAGAGASPDLNNAHFYFNTDNASSTYSSQRTGQVNGGVDLGHSATDSFFQYFYITAQNGATTGFYMTSAKVYIPEYRNTNFNKQVYFTSGGGAQFINSEVCSLYGGLWASTAAINAVTFRVTGFGSGTNFKNGSMFSLYGILRA